MAPGLTGSLAALLPVLLGAAWGFLAPWHGVGAVRWLPPAVAVAALAMALAAAAGQPSAMALLAVLTSTVWLAGTVCDALDGADGARAAVMAGAIALAGVLPLDQVALAAAGAAVVAGLANPVPLLPAFALAASGWALGLPILAWVALGVMCLHPAIGAGLPRGQAMLLGPLAGIWVVAALPLPHWVLLAAGLAGVVVCAERLRRGVDLGVLVLAVALFAVAAIGAGSQAAALLHVALGCLALVAALTCGRPATLGVAALLGVPPLGVAASALSAIVGAGAQGVAGPLLLAAGFLVVVLAALPLLPRQMPPGPAAPVGWAAIGLALAGGWALPDPVAQILASAAQ